MRRIGAGSSVSTAFGCYLLALLTLPLRWLSPIASVFEHAAWTDVFIGAAAVLWLSERVRDGRLRGSLRRWHAPLAVYLTLAAASALVSSQMRSTSWGTVLLMVELAVLAAITADFARDPEPRRLIARAVAASAVLTVALAALGLVLFYAGVDTGLLGAYGEQYTPSSLYARVRAGFESPPLLASFCIFASGVVASDETGLSPRRRLILQIGLGLVCAATLSRGLIGFLLAIAVRGSRLLPARRRMAVSLAAVLAALGIVGALTAGRLHLDPTRPASIAYSAPDPGNRREAFVTSLSTLARHPVLGVGPGASPGRNRGVPFRAHMTPLNIAATVGVPALLAVIAMLVLLWRRRARPADIALWSAAAGLALDGLAQDIDHFRHVWILIGLLAANAPAIGRAGLTPPQASATLDNPQPRFRSAGGIRWPA